MLNNIYNQDNLGYRHQQLLEEANANRMLKQTKKKKGWSLPKLRNPFAQPKEKVTVVIPVNRSFSSS